MRTQARDAGDRSLAGAEAHRRGRANRRIDARAVHVKPLSNAHTRAMRRSGRGNCL